MLDTKRYISFTPEIATDPDLPFIRVLSVVFDTPISAYDLRKFRAALAEKIGFEHDWFHNHHVNEEHGVNGKVYYRYPMIQYKMKRDQPQLICIGPGLEAAKMFFESWQWDIEMKGEPVSMDIDELKVKKYPIGVANSQEAGMPFRYFIKSWQALNQDNYRKYQEMEGLKEIISFLESLLANNIILFAKEIGWSVPHRFELEITEMYPQRGKEIKGNEHLTFTFEFRSNILLPSFIGLGKGVSLGNGTIKQLINRRKRSLHS